MPGCTPSTALCTYDSRKFVPIFVLTKDRVTVLKVVLQSFQKLIQHVRYRVIILDQDSTYPPMVDFLDSIPQEYNVEKVHHLKKHPVPTNLHRFRQSVMEASAYIQDYLANRTEDVEYYIFTDPDVALENTLPDILLFYMGILQSCPGIEVIGPSLPISDIPESYEHRKFVYDDGTPFWTSQVPHMAIWKGYGYHLIPALIDTTFSMRRRSTPFKRLPANSFRTFAPYAAKHLDWYNIDELRAQFNTSDEEFQNERRWYRGRQRGVNHYTTTD